MADYKSIAVLTGIGGHQPTREQLEHQFNWHSLDFSMVLDWPLEKRETIRAIASLMHKVDPTLMDALPNLEIVASFGVGYDHVDATYAASRGITVTHTPSVLDDEVADTTIALLLNTLRRFYFAEQYLRDGRWEPEGSFGLTPLSMRNRSVGIYGLGRIGKTIAKRLSGFDVPIHYHSRNPVADVDFTYHATLTGLAEAVDTLIVIVPGTPATHHTVNADVLSALGSRGVLINVGRGPTVDEQALIAALKDGTIAGAGLDVFEFEPKVPQALLDLPNVSALPHVASASQDTRKAMGDLVVNNLLQWFEEDSAITPVPESASLTR